MYQLRKKNLADSVAIYVRDQELFRPPTYIFALEYGVTGTEQVSRNFRTLDKPYKRNIKQNLIKNPTNI